jgi:hypothetical protein
VTRCAAGLRRIAQRREWRSRIGSAAIDPRRTSPRCAPAASPVRAVAWIVALACTAFVGACGGDDAKTTTARPTTARPTTPTGASGDAQEGDVSCPADVSDEGSDGWVYHAFVSPDRGLVVQDLRFGPRTIAHELSVPYVRGFGSNHGYSHLTPKQSPDAADDLKSTLLHTDCDPGGHPGVSATYRLVSAATGVSYLVQQSYRFDPFNSDTRCEASESARCVRFWPTVTWGLESSSKEDPVNQELGLEVVQRFEFDPDGMATEPDGADAVSADITRDRPALGAMGISHLARRGALLKEGAIDAVKEGKIVKWENWHQSDRSMVGLPGVPHDAIGPLHGSGYAGCTECVHAHWSWFGGFATGISQVHACGSAQCWTTGDPQILPTSRQTACIGWVRAGSSADDDGPVDWCDRPFANRPEAAIGPGASPGALAMYWDARTTAATSPTSGVTIGDTQMSVGDTSWPQLPAGDEPVADRFAGDTGAMFAVPARRLTTVGTVTGPGEVAITAGDPVHNVSPGSRLPAGWVVPISLGLAPGTDQGPYYLRVHAKGLRLLNTAPSYSSANTGAPWVDVYDDGPSPDSNAKSRRVVEHMVESKRHGAQTPDPSPLHAFIVFDQRPTETNDVSYELDAAPDGVRDYVASTGEWSDPLTSVNDPDPSAASDFTIKMNREWQYSLSERRGESLASTGGGLASSLGVYGKGLQVGPASAYLLPAGETGSRATCFRHVTNANDHYELTWGPDKRSNTLPWSQLPAGAQACINGSNNLISLMTVLQPWNGSAILVHARTWECEPPPEESVC